MVISNGKNIMKNCNFKKILLMSTNPRIDCCNKLNFCASKQKFYKRTAVKAMCRLHLSNLIMDNFYFLKQIFLK